MLLHPIHLLKNLCFLRVDRFIPCNLRFTIHTVPIQFQDICSNKMNLVSTFDWFDKHTIIIWYICLLLLYIYILVYIYIIIYIYITIYMIIYTIIYLIIYIIIYIIIYSMQIIVQIYIYIIHLQKWGCVKTYYHLWGRTIHPTGLELMGCRLVHGQFADGGLGRTTNSPSLEGLLDGSSHLVSGL